MESRASDTIPRDDAEWQYEPKCDGFRALAFRDGDAVDLVGKSGKPLGRYFPEVLETLRRLPLDRFIVDGELLIEIEGRLSFDALQMRLHLRRAGCESSPLGRPRSSCCSASGFRRTGQSPVSR